jgi:urease accessory protein
MNVRLLQISDSALPISGYTHSWGLEAAIARGLVHDAESLEQWAGQWLRTSLGPLEGVLVASSFRAAQTGAPEELRELNQLADVSILPGTIRRASREMGEQLIELAATWSWCARGLAPFQQAQKTGWHHSVAYGLLGHLAKGDLAGVLLAYLHQAVLGVIGAGVRAIPVGHTHGQQVLAYMHGVIHETAEAVSRQTLETAGAGCPYYEVLCDEQTRLYARMFRS